MSVLLPPGYTAIQPDSVDGFGDVIGPVFLDNVGRRLSFLVRNEHRNINGFCHGGALALFADCQVAVVRDSIPALIGHTPTISLKIDYIAPVPIGELIEMQVTLVRYTRSMLFTQGIMTVGGTTVGRTDAIYRWYAVKTNPGNEDASE